MDENELEIDLDDFSFPIANEENKKLEVVNQQKTKKISHLEGQIEETSGRIQAIAEHLKNVRQELQCTQARDKGKTCLLVIHYWWCVCVCM